ncbi:MAG: hypothetical protein H6Q18_222 [Bacteroidetes bacterium]|nr:hypothetical protein [Bacteroidota bacterium]
MESSLIILIAFVTLVAGFLTAWLVQSKNLNRHKLSSELIRKQLQDEKTGFENQFLVAQETLRIKSDDLQKIQNDFLQISDLAEERGMELTGFQVTNKNLLEKLENQKTEIDELQKRLTAEFENIATKILKERSEEFSASNHKNLSQILNPLQEKIQMFEKKVDETYDKDLRDKISLREEIKKLTELNTRVSDEANNLTKALKGDVKKQGNWGEVVLERVLERSGLTKGQEYETQVDVMSNDEFHQRPDVIIHLPDEKHIIIDSKVSLIAYERYSSAETADEKTRYMKEHVVSLRSHVKELSEKNYQAGIKINSPDFVLMFLPVEASFSVAVQADAEIFTYAWDRKIVIVSPTTLLATLRTISSIWRQENQTKNAQEIARLSKALHDKFLAFVDDMSKIKTNIDRASGAYDDALKKMKDGKGNIIRTAERIQELGGFDEKKQLPADFEIF